MGIPSYFSQLVSTYSKVLAKWNRDSFEKVDNLYLDSNSIVYDSYHEMCKESAPQPAAVISEECGDRVIRRVIHKIEEYIAILRPQNRVYIAFDGVAPRAKLEQQRERRHKNAFLSDMKKQIMEEARMPHSQQQQQQKATVIDADWDTAAITPGTEFMRRLNQRVRAHFCSYPTHSPTILVSGSDEPGEGEHKLFAFIRDHADKHANQVTFIYGLDADLIMLCLFHLQYCRSSNGALYLYRESPHFAMKHLEPDTPYVVAISDLAAAITDTLLPPTQKEKKGMESTNLYSSAPLFFDYLFLCFFVGNDFLPHFPALNIRTGGIDKLINAYHHVVASSAPNPNPTPRRSYFFTKDGKTIRWARARTFINHLAANENAFIVEEYTQRNHMQRRLQRAKQERDAAGICNAALDVDEEMRSVESMPLLERSVERYVDPTRKGWQSRYYTGLFVSSNGRDSGSRHGASAISPDTVSLHYLQGLEWTFTYYTQGCRDWRWHYPFAYPPLLCDLAQVVPDIDNTIDADNTTTSTANTLIPFTFVPQLPPAPLPELAVLAYVLPKKALHLLPADLRCTLEYEYAHWYDFQNEYLWAFCKYFWEAHPLLPEIDLEALEECVRSREQTFYA